MGVKKGVCVYGCKKKKKKKKKGVGGENDKSN